jgi:hypothetical protein
LLEDVLGGVEWAVACDPEFFEAVDGVPGLRVVKTYPVDDLPGFRIFYRLDANGQVLFEDLDVVATSEAEDEAPF